MINVSIILPFFNRWDLTHARLYELVQHVPLGNVEIILMDDASTEPDCQSGVAWWQKNSLHNIRYKRNEKNLGFGGNCNEGARAATGDILVFLSNDVIIRGNFLASLVRILAEKTPHALVGGQLIDWAGGWNEIEYNGGVSVVPYLAGWLLACTRETWKLLGGFDPRFGVFDYEDMDLCTTAHILGTPLIPLNSPDLDHLSGATIRTLAMDRYSQTMKNKDVYHQKWQGKWDIVFERCADE